MLKSSSSTRRALVVGIIAVIVLVAQTPISSALPNDYDFQVAAKKSGTWRGIDVHISFHDPGIQSDSAQYVAAPVGLTTYSTGSSAYFIEIGPIKTCYAVLRAEIFDSDQGYSV